MTIDESGTVRVDWSERVKFADNVAGGPFAYVPGGILTTVSDAHERLNKIRGRLNAGDGLILGWEPVLDSIGRIVAKDADDNEQTLPDDIPALIEELRLENIAAQPNHVFFTHATGGWMANPAYANPAYANPAYANPAYANPAYANPAYANPAYANPAYANPAYANPAYANPAYANPADPRRETGLRLSTARPVTLKKEAMDALADTFALPGIKNGPRIIVLDTGLAGEFQPASFTAALFATDPDPADFADSDGNDLLDPAAGHGTFITGLIKQVCPEVMVENHKVLKGYGDGDELSIAQKLNELAIDSSTIVNLSFGGYVMDEPLAMAAAIRKVQSKGGVVVSSAGNDGLCRPSYPAALSGVISVGAIGPFGPAGFSNWGPWVRACAPGVDLISAFFQDFKGKGREPGPDGADPDDFNGWARWSGTSFAAPIVAAAIARTMLVGAGCTAKDAADRVVDGPGLFRIPGLGTVVNLV